MIPVIVIRPEPGCSASVAGARELGLEAHGFPLFSVSPVAWDAPTDPAFDVLLAGSANAFRHGGGNLARFSTLPVHAVGESTARAARGAGFAVAATGSGGLQGQLDRLPSGTRVLRLAGAERIELKPPAGVAMTERTVYVSTPSPMPGDLVRMLSRPALILVHSAEAARHLASECEGHGIVTALHRLVAIGPRVADAMPGTDWAEVATAASPSETAMLAKAAELCQITDQDREPH